MEELSRFERNIRGVIKILDKIDKKVLIGIIIGISIDERTKGDTK